MAYSRSDAQASVALWYGQLAALDPGEDLLGVVAERQAEVVDERHGPVGRGPRRIERHLGVGRPALDERAARVVADAAEHRGADAGRADHRMRLAPERPQRLLKRVEGGAGQADHLPPAVDQVDAPEPPQADEHDLAVVVVPPRRRAAGEAGVRRLEDHDPPGGDGGVSAPATARRGCPAGPPPPPARCRSGSRGYSRGCPGPRSAPAPGRRCGRARRSASLSVSSLPPGGGSGRRAPRTLAQFAAGTAAPRPAPCAVNGGT